MSWQLYYFVNSTRNEKSWRMFFYNRLLSLKSHFIVHSKFDSHFQRGHETIGQPNFGECFDWVWNQKNCQTLQPMISWPHWNKTLVDRLWWIVKAISSELKSPFGVRFPWQKFTLGMCQHTKWSKWTKSQLCDPTLNVLNGKRFWIILFEIKEKSKSSPKTIKVGSTWKIKVLKTEPISVLKSVLNSFHHHSLKMDL